MAQPGTSRDPQIVSHLNSFLRGEISAIETYDLAIRKLAEDKEHLEEAAQLRMILQDHFKSAQRLREEVIRLGGKPDDSSGAWGAYAMSIEGVATLFGDTSALKALKEGEEHGLKDYERDLKHLNDSAQRMVSEHLIPTQQRHIATLNAMIKSL